MSELEMREMYALKQDTEVVITMYATRHTPPDPLQDVIFTWTNGGVRISLPPLFAQDVDRVIQAFQQGLRRTTHWDKAARINVEFEDCAYAECLCRTMGAPDIRQ